MKDRECIKVLGDKDYKVYKDRWNQVGGPEILALRHYDGSNICFANGEVKFIKHKELALLDWRLDSNTVFILPLQ